MHQSRKVDSNVIINDCTQPLTCGLKKSVRKRCNKTLIKTGTAGNGEQTPHLKEKEKAQRETPKENLVGKELVTTGRKTDTAPTGSQAARTNTMTLTKGNVVDEATDADEDADVKEVKAKARKTKVKEKAKRTKVKETMKKEDAQKADGKIQASQAEENHPPAT